MISVAVVEDEIGASDHLVNLLSGYSAGVQVSSILRSVEDSVSWFESNPHPKLGLFDIQLNDGTSFEIFERTTISFPIIFTTAFNQYAIQAFRVNSIDYLLKPVKAGELYRALDKYSMLQPFAPFDYSALAREMAGIQRSRVFTLLVSQRERLIPLPSIDFSYFIISNGILHGISGGKVYPLSGVTMDELQERLDPVEFFRVNRQCIVNRASISHMEPHFHSKLVLKLNVPIPETIIVSKARVPFLKVWLSTGQQ